MSDLFREFEKTGLSEFMKGCSMSRLREEITNDKGFRDLFSAEFIITGLGFQLNVLRRSRGLSVSELAKKAFISEEDIMIMEECDGSLPDLQMLHKLASVFDVALLARFATFDRILEEFENLSPEIIAPKPFLERD